jgi:hypothetical protein
MIGMRNAMHNVGSRIAKEVHQLESDIFVRNVAKG